jgi:hypothetical protein
MCASVDPNFHRSSAGTAGRDPQTRRRRWHGPGALSPLYQGDLVELANGPGMTVFGPDGKYGFVCSSFAPELAVTDAASHQVVKRLPQGSPFCPNIAVSPENDEGKVQVFGAKPPFEQKAVLETAAPCGTL